MGVGVSWSVNAIFPIHSLFWDHNYHTQLIIAKHLTDIHDEVFGQHHKYSSIEGKCTV